MSSDYVGLPDGYPGGRPVPPPPGKAGERSRVVCADVARIEAVEFARRRLGFEPDEKQAEVLGSQAKRGILNCTRQWGKSTVTAAMAVYRAWSRAGALVLVLTPTARQSWEFVRKAAGFVRTLGLPVRSDGRHTMSLLLPNGSRIIGLPGKSGDTIRGFSAAALLLVDEAARVDDDVYCALRASMAVGGGDLWLMSTPNGREGFFWETWAGSAEGWHRVAVTATECPRIGASFLEEERETIGGRRFRQEYLCEFLESEGALFARELVEAALDQTAEPEYVL